MKFGLNKQRVLFGLLFGVLGLNAAWFQQLSKPSSITELSSGFGGGFGGETNCDISAGNTCERTVPIEKSVDGKKSITQIKYRYKMTSLGEISKTPVGSKEAVKTEAVAIAISRVDCPGCKEVFSQPYTVEEAQKAGLSLSRVAQEQIDKMAAIEAENMKREVEVAKENKEKEKKEQKLADQREKCEIDDENKKLSGHAKTKCLVEKIPGIDDPAKRDAAFAMLQPHIRDMLISGNPTDKAQARELLTLLGTADNGTSISQTARAMLAGDKYETEIERTLVRMSRTRRGSAEFTQLSNKLRGIARRMDRDLIQNAERADEAGKASGLSLSEADFWVARLGDNMRYALRSPQEARNSLFELQGRSASSSISGAMDRLDDELDRRGSRLDRRDLDGRRRYVTPTSANRGRAGIRGSRRPVYADRYYNASGRDYGYRQYDDELDLDSDYLDRGDDYYDGFRPSTTRRGGAERSRVGTRYSRRRL